MPVPRRAAVVAAAVAAAVLTTGTPAWAHNELRGAEPADGATVTAAPAAVVLEFAERLDPRYTRIAVTGPGGGSVLDGGPRVSGARARQPLRAGLADGTYTVVFRVASLDGHPVQGRTTFVLRGGAPATTAPAPTAPAPTAAPSPAATTPVARTPVASRGGPSSLGWLITVGLLLLAAAGGGLMLRRRRGSAP